MTTGKRPTPKKKPLGRRLKELAETGASVSAVHETLRAEGYDVGRATVGRALQKLRGPLRSRIGQRDAASQAPSPAPAPETTNANETLKLDSPVAVMELASTLAREPSAPIRARAGDLAVRALSEQRHREPPTRQDLTEW